MTGEPKKRLNKFSIWLMAGMLLISIVGHSCKPVLKVKKEIQYKVGVVDLMILKRQKISALPLAKEIGADGVEVDMGGLGNRPTFNNKLIDPVIRKQYLDTARQLGIEISSLAMTGFYSQSLPEREGAVETIQDCINTMVLMQVKVGFLPLGVEGDLIQYPERRAAIVERLKEVGKKAEAAGVVIGIETALDAKGEVELLNDIGSPAIQICFNFANPLKNGRDINEELKILGKDRICEIHATNKDSVWLENDPQIDMHQIKTTLDELGWSGWLLVERSRDANNTRDVRGNFGANVAYLKSVFQ
ncbi:sugar phosphate isomerase/epimerase family protein [uncultured Sunxiuqinia sp.]|uniref:sugar phosphate isomerase/epimerase family protein n=1 Tax=uncultured Sunxiuqinia sp. TaxID=1573825 RepID=UPI002AA7316E|nr:sugar phosphate isomerase/epimerase family protein [uncultured Sunxiuqinia sp.]